jgi:hypothetical protein
MPPFSEVLGISLDIFNRDILAKNLNIANHYTYTLAPHIALVLASLNDDGLCFFCDLDVVEWGESGGGWSSMVLMLGIWSLLEIKMPTLARHALASKIQVFMERTSHYFVEVINLSSDPTRRQEASFLLRTALHRCRAANVSSKFNIRLIIYTIFLKFPQLSRSLYLAACKLKGVKPIAGILGDKVARS